MERETLPTFKSFCEEIKSKMLFNERDLGEPRLDTVE